LSNDLAGPRPLPRAQQRAARQAGVLEADEVAELRNVGHLGPKPAEEPVPDALHVGQRPVGQVVGAAVRQRPAVQRGVEQLARSAREGEPSVELREAALFDVAHRSPQPLVWTLRASLSGDSAGHREQGTVRRFQDTASDGTGSIAERRVRPVVHGFGSVSTATARHPVAVR